METPKPRRQCQKCPWKVRVDPHDIPGYCEDLHASLTRTIATPGDLFSEFKMMACHETVPDRQLPCVGWLHHQLGEGNNLGLRYAVSLGKVDANVEVVGPQHSTFEDTLPDDTLAKRSSKRLGGGTKK